MEGSTETIYPGEGENLRVQKLSEFACAFLKHRGAIPSALVRVFAYMDSGSRWTPAAMRQRQTAARTVLIQKGVPPSAVTLEELLHSSNLSGLVRVTFYELPELVPKVPLPPPGPSGSQSSATRSDGSEGYKVEGSVIYAPPGGIQTDVEITVVDANRNRKKLPKMSLTMTVGAKGLEEVGAEFTLLKRQLRKQLFWGAIRDVQFAVKFNAQVKFERDGARDVLDGWAAKFKATISADLGIPRSISVPVEAWVYIDAGGKPGAGAQLTLFQF